MKLNHTLDELRAIAAAELHYDGKVSTLTADAIALHEIVAKLPRTADGVPVVPGMVLFCPDGHEQRPIAPMQKRSECMHDDCYDDTIGDKHGYRYELSCCFSTRAAAEAASKQ